MISLEEPQNKQLFPLFNLGFRPFFLLAGIYAAAAMLLWLLIYILGYNVLPTEYPAMLWHGHEMIFGFAMAVISGFLLTAVGNWTNRRTLNGSALMGLASLWLLARLLPFSGLSEALLWTGILDTLFAAGLIAAITLPIIQARQWMQFSVVSKVILLGIFNGLFYLGLLGILPVAALQWGVLGGFYLVISLILLMGRRVIPFFIEKGVDESVELKNRKWLDISSLVFFLIFMIVEVFLSQAAISALLAAILFILHSIRMWGWYAAGIWKKPLLWVLYIGYGFIVLGFALKALSWLLPISPWIALHAFAVGGIGMITAGMMCRVALGHTGRNVFAPPASLKIIFALLLIATVLRVIPPMLLPALQAWWLVLSQLFWIAGFTGFVFIYAPMLIKPRVDGRFG